MRTARDLRGVAGRLLRHGLAGPRAGWSVRTSGGQSPRRRDRDRPDRVRLSFRALPDCLSGRCAIRRDHLQRSFQEGMGSLRSSAIPVTTSFLTNFASVRLIWHVQIASIVIAHVAAVSIAHLDCDPSGRSAPDRDRRPAPDDDVDDRLHPLRIVAAFRAGDRLAWTPSLSGNGPAPKSWIRSKPRMAAALENERSWRIDGAGRSRGGMIQIEGLNVRFGEFQAVQGVSFRSPRARRSVWSASPARARPRSEGDRGSDRRLAGAHRDRRRDAGSPTLQDVLPQGTDGVPGPVRLLHPRHTVDRTLAEPPSIHGLGSVGARVERMLDAVGLGPRVPLPLSAPALGRAAPARWRSRAP